MLPGRRRTLPAISASVFFLGALAVNHSASAQTIAESCRADLDALPDFILENDAGGRDGIARQGKALSARILAKAQEMTAAVTTDADCLRILDSYVQTYRHEHLWVTAVEAGKGGGGAAGDRKNDVHDPLLPSYRALSRRTALMVIPSFYPIYAEKIKLLIEKNKSSIGRHQNLIIDVRKNGGGSDDSFGPLMPYLLANPVRTFDVEYLATDANIKGLEQLCGSSAYVPSTQDCKRLVAPRVELLRNAKPGDFVTLPGTKAEGAIDSIVKGTKNPSRVAILIDKECGSSCDQFLINARQSFKVKLFGRPSLGSVDYSNIVNHTLPSGKRSLGYAISRSLRLPELPLGSGVQPDQLLKQPTDEAAYADEVRQVRANLESEQ